MDVPLSELPRYTVAREDLPPPYTAANRPGAPGTPVETSSSPVPELRAASLHEAPSAGPANSQGKNIARRIKQVVFGLGLANLAVVAWFSGKGAQFRGKSDLALGLKMHECLDAVAQFHAGLSNDTQACSPYDVSIIPAFYDALEAHAPGRAIPFGGIPLAELEEGEGVCKVNAQDWCHKDLSLQHNPFTAPVLWGAISTLLAEATVALPPIMRSLGGKVPSVAVGFVAAGAAGTLAAEAILFDALRHDPQDPAPKQAAHLNAVPFQLTTGSTPHEVG